MLHRLVNSVLDAFGFGDVRSDRDRLTTCLDDQLRGLFTGLGVQFGDHDLCALLRE